MRIERFTPEHLQRLLLQPAQEYMAANLADPAYVHALGEHDAFSAIDGDRVIACAGFVPIWQGRSVAWALLAKDIGERMVFVHRATLRILNGRPERRIEAYCDTRFDAANRWIQLLGFKFEGRMAGFTPDGSDQDLFARVAA